MKSIKNCKIGEDVKFIDLHIFKNKRNGQQSTVFPKKLFNNLPDKIKVQIPIEFFKLNKKQMKGGNL